MTLLLRCTKLPQSIIWYKYAKKMWQIFACLMDNPEFCVGKQKREYFLLSLCNPKTNKWKSYAKLHFITRYHEMKKLRTKEPQIGILFLHISSMQNDIFASSRCCAYRCNWVRTRVWCGSYVRPPPNLPWGRNAIRGIFWITSFPLLRSWKLKNKS